MILKKTFAIIISFFLFFSCTKEKETVNHPKLEIPEIKTFKFEADDNNNLLKDISATINAEEKKIIVAFPPYTSLKNLTPSITVSDGAIISPNSMVQQDLSETIVYTLSGEAYETIDYILYASVEEGKKAAVINFSFSQSNNPHLADNITSIIESETIKAEVSDTLNISALIPSIEISEGASISPDSSQPMDFTKEVKYIVTAQDATTQSEYIVQIKRLSSDKKITAFKINVNGNTYDADINDNTFEITLSLPFKTALGSLSPIIEFGKNASITPSSNIPQDFNETVLYEVIAEDGSKQLYEVSITTLSASENDRAVLEELYKANKDYNPAFTYLDWDLDANTMENWQGVTISNHRVTELQLSTIYLNEIPQSIGQLSELKSLTIVGTQLRELPAQIGNLEKLEQLSLYDNNLSSIPVEIGKLESVLHIHLQKNQLQKIPAEIGQLTKLIWLEVQSNNINELPLELAEIPNLLNLNIKDNPLTNIPQVICDKKTEINNLSIIILKDDEDSCN